MNSDSAHRHEPRATLGAVSTSSRQSPRSGLRRWGPAALLVCVASGGVFALLLQHVQIQQVSGTLRSLLPLAQAEASSSTQPAEAANSSAAKPPPLSEEEETRQLQEKIDAISAEIAQLNNLRSENEKLRAQLAAPPVHSNAPPDVATMQAAKERALRTACMNNMKQMGLAARLWAQDNNDIYPPDIISMSNELNTPKILVCPSDARQPAADWGSYSAGNCSYDFLAPSANLLEPNRVMFRCPIHGNYGLCDGSVQSLSAEAAATALVQRDGKLYLEYKNP